MVLSTQATPASEVGLAGLVEPHDDRDAASLQGRDRPVRAEEPVGQGDVAGLELIEDLPEEGQLAGLLALVRSQRGLEHRAHGQAEHHEEPRDREPDPWRLAVQLGIRRLVLWGIGHGHGGTVDELDRSPVKQPGVLRLVMDRFPGPADEIPGELLGQPLAGLAVAARLGSHRGEPLIIAELLEPLDGVVTGVVIGKDLGQKDPQGNPRGVDAFSPGMVAESARLLDESPREELEERQPLLRAELVAQGIELLAWGCGSSLSHGDLLGW
jgi:hypothetical protein